MNIQNPYRPCIETAMASFDDSATFYELLASQPKKMDAYSQMASAMVRIRSVGVGAGAAGRRSALENAASEKGIGNVTQKRNLQHPYPAQARLCVLGATWRCVGSGTEDPPPVT